MTGPPLETSHEVGPPLWLLLELTYRCPLHCVFCYNPTEFARTGAELPTAEWIRVLREARALGAVQLGLSGGEPLERFATRAAQERALQVLQFKLDVLWQMNDAMALAYGVTQ